ncbi:uncharacterized protein CC84DRAFT_1169063 [Paraphaeosphaeria sporulosa]|uniref:Uncharacterized protein n=1 Tax=Paraphaeosphaeria sporulosa TaxID=1460663 RepID=A0A177BY12_9PLEO|nr:uncharacterized protein CC84DRAFT_1169063 [Paraphaeosphaeria sporulosa]OAG00243.1 hypothetical protein CC84DRAFT_1169063 [Paraphaeosphaeria sporulosa]
MRRLWTILLTLEIAVQWLPVPASLKFGSGAATIGYTNQTWKLVVGNRVTLVMLISFFEAV